MKFWFTSLVAILVGASILPMDRSAALGLQEKAGAKDTEARKPQLKPDPEASRLLAEARRNRALWKNFPGFTANIEVNLDSKISRGNLRIDAKGKVVLGHLDKAAERWARQVLTTDVDHRLNADIEETACVFTDDDAHNPLGRAVTLLGDGMGSMYRVRDKQIVVVNREVDKMRFAITVLQTTLNAEGKYLPGSFVVHYWDGEQGDLRKTDAYSHTWKRVGTFDLPLTTRIVTTSRQVSVKSMTLSNHHLLTEGSR
jgi:hypothetical protein